MNIGAAAKSAGVSAKMIRYYESVGLIPPATRSESGYRVYSPADVHSLCFIKRARTLGFSLDRIAALLALWHDQGRASAAVKQVARGHVTALKTRIAELQGMVQTLEHLIDHCHGDGRPECPILADLAEVESAPGPTARRGGAKTAGAVRAPVS